MSYTPPIGKQNGLVNLHGNRFGISQVDANNNAALLLDGYAVAGIQGITYKSGLSGIAALAGGGQSSLSSFILNDLVNVLTTVATASDSVMLPTTAGNIPSGGALELVVINASSIAAAIFPSSGDTINVLSANASFAMASSGVSIFFTASSGHWYTK